MSRVHLLTDAGEVARRRKLAPPGRLLEAWPDLYTAGHAWVGEEARRLLEDAAGALPVALSLDAPAVPVYYGPRPDLPAELAKYPGLKYAGYGFALPKLAPGTYPLEVVWVAKDGGVTTVTRSIEIRAGSRPRRPAAKP